MGSFSSGEGNWSNYSMMKHLFHLFNSSSERGGDIENMYAIISYYISNSLHLMLN